MTELSKARATGPLTAHVEGFCAELVGRGCTPRTAGDRGYGPAHLSRLLEAEHLEPSELTPPVVDRFLCARRRGGYRRWPSTGSVRPLLVAAVKC